MSDETKETREELIERCAKAMHQHWEERNRELVRERDEARDFLRRTAMTGGSIVSSAAMTATQIAIAQAADRMLVTPDGYGSVYIPGPRFCACGRVESDCDQSRASCPKADPASEGDDETDKPGNCAGITPAAGSSSLSTDTLAIIAAMFEMTQMIAHERSLNEQGRYAGIDYARKLAERVGLR